MIRIKKRRCGPLSMLMAGLIFLSVMVMIVFVRTSGYAQQPMNVVLGTTLFLSVLLIYLYRHNNALSILFAFLAYVNYSIVMGVYWVPELRPYALYKQINDVQVYGEGAVSLLIFTAVLSVLALLRPIRKNTEAKEESVRSNRWVVLVCLLGYAVIMISEGGVSSGGRAHVSALGEYRYILMILGCYYSPKNNRYRMMWALIAAMTVLMTFSGGNRINALPIIFVYVLIWHSDVNLAKFLPLLPVAIVLLNMIGAMRQNFEFTLSGMQRVMARTMEDAFAVDTFYYAYFPGLCSLQMTDVMDAAAKADLLIKNLLYIVMGGSYGNYILSNVTRDYFIHYFGFIAPLNLNFWMGSAGAAVIALIVHKATRLTEKNDRYMKILAVAFVATCARWYVYNVLLLPRTLFLVSVAWVCIEFVNRVTLKKRTL